MLNWHFFKDILLDFFFLFARLFELFLFGFFALIVLYEALCNPGFKRCYINKILIAHLLKKKAGKTNTCSDKIETLQFVESDN